MFKKIWKLTITFFCLSALFSMTAFAGNDAPLIKTLGGESLESSTRAPAPPLTSLKISGFRDYKETSGITRHCILVTAMGYSSGVAGMLDGKEIGVVNIATIWGPSGTGIGSVYYYDLGNIKSGSHKFYTVGTSSASPHNTYSDTLNFVWPLQ